MSLTQVDIDDDALAEAMRLMGSKTKKETVNRALEEYSARLKRIEASRWMAEQGAQGAFDKAAAAHEAAKEARKTEFDQNDQIQQAA